MKDKEILKLEILDCADIKLAYLDDMRISKSKPLSLMHNIFTIACRKDYILEALGISKDSVVLSREELQNIKTLEYMNGKTRGSTEVLGIHLEQLEKVEKKARKETAEKVIMDFYHELITSFKGRVITYDSFCKIAQKHNIEIPRETFTLAELEAKHEDVEIKE